MKFGPVPIGESLGTIAVHAVRGEGVILKKGDRIAAMHIAALRSAGIGELVVARLEAGDIGEDAAARRLAEALAGRNLRVDRAFTGRANLFAERAGIFLADEPMVGRVNGIDEAVTLATLPAYRTVVADEMVATVKIIPFAVAGAVLEQAVRAMLERKLSIAPFKPMTIGVVSTLLPGLKQSVVDKTLRVLEDRLEPAHAKIGADLRVPHESAALAFALRRLRRDSDLIVVFGASAITDRRDVIPVAVEEAGGHIAHFGMPVDPGNLLLLGDLDGKPVIGAPGCARSPKENGFDWILHRLLAEIPVTAADIRRLGVGGLLMEIVSRPQPRAGTDAEPRDDHG